MTAPAGGRERQRTGIDEEPLRNRGWMMKKKWQFSAAGPAGEGSGLSSGGYYGIRIRKCRNIWIWSAALALLCTFVSYPGIWYSDSYVRVETGRAALNAVVKTLIGQGRPLETRNHFTLIPSFAMIPSLALTGHVGLYTFFQAFAFFAATFLLIRELNPAWGKTQYVLFGLSPLIYGASVYYEAGIGCAAGMAALLLLLRRVKDAKGKRDRLLEFLLIAFWSLITFGYRTNALTIMPVLLFYLWRNRLPRMLMLLTVLALALGVVLTAAVPAVFQVHGLSNGMTGFAWEILLTIQRMEPEKQAAYLDYLDEVGGEGATRGALEVNNDISVDAFMDYSDINPETMSRPGAGGKILVRYFQLIRQEPGLWWQVKWEMLKRTFALDGPMAVSEYNYNRWDRMQEYGMVDSPARQAFHRSYLEANRLLGFFTCRPWAVFLVTAVMTLIQALRRSRKTELYVLIFLTAVFFYGAFVLINVCFDLRYFYPALYLMMIMDAEITLDWLQALKRRFGSGEGEKKTGQEKPASPREKTLIP